MTTLSRSDAATSLKLLSEVAAARQADPEQYENDEGLTTESDDDANSDSPILDQFYEEGGQNAIHQMTNFSAREFESIYDIIKEDLDQTLCA